jgi:hypothetical protein
VLVVEVNTGCMAIPLMFVLVAMVVLDWSDSKER